MRSYRSGVLAERAEAVRVLRTQDPDATYETIADRLAAWRPELTPAYQSRRAKMMMVCRAVKSIEVEQEFELLVPLPEAEQARRVFVRRLEEIFSEAMQVGDLRTARDAARDVAKACGADIELPIRIEPVKSGLNLSEVPTEHIAGFVAGLSGEDRAAVERAFPSLLAAVVEGEAN